ncbi:expressed unknown protein [Seminavis robusta]|uniref:Uncharacterized protein n=1 Tax=Seminavis robusta TaxID=568900 RepID=A0A9N8H135_9STRA|nr:expressed unknown protein [Seminavis robusta]|eukprot:Sro10_g008040.1 n/a (1236) ;mRNA; r:92303-96010
MSTLSFPNYNGMVQQVDTHFYFVGFATWINYAILLSTVYSVAMPWYRNQAGGAKPSQEEDCISALPIERAAALVAFLVLVFTILIFYLPLFVYPAAARTGFRKISGVVFTGLAVVSTAATSNAVMAFAPDQYNPILIDPITHSRVHILRWVEWTVMAGTMMFLVEACDVPDHATQNASQILQWAYTHGALQAAATLMGLLLPFAQNTTQWAIILIIACVIYFVMMFKRLRAKYQRFKLLQKGSRLDELEIYHRAKIALQLLVTCACGWSSLVACYLIFSWWAPIWAAKTDNNDGSSIIAHPATPMIVECFLDVVLKSFYNFYVISIHEHVFDEEARSKRRLEELRQSIWANSSDILALSVRSLSGVVTTTVSPTLFRMLREGRTAIQYQYEYQDQLDAMDQSTLQYGQQLQEQERQRTRDEKEQDRTTGMSFEMTPDNIRELLWHAAVPQSASSLSPNVHLKPAQYDFADAYTAGSTSTASLPSFIRQPPVARTDPQNLLPETVIGPQEMQALATLMARSWQCGSRDTILSQELVLRKVDNKSNNDGNDENNHKDQSEGTHTIVNNGKNPFSPRLHQEERHGIKTQRQVKEVESIPCEALVTRLDDSALFVVVRDITERHRRFEAEKLAFSEMTARMRDSEANRFTRHEVKNGLLASLGLCEGLTDLSNKQSKTTAALERLTRASAACSGAALGDAAGAATSLAECAEDIRTLASTQENLMRVVKEMNSTLHETLETVLTEAMARDCIHGVYQPQLEPVGVVKMLRGLVNQREGSAERFPITTAGTFPRFLMLDPRLFKCVHRNALSNAAKYGAKKKPITTQVSYDHESKVFRMSVRNFPGDHHPKLKALGSDGAMKVFQKGKRLHSALGSETSGMARHSAGDGAWIMQQCCNCVQGECSIEFLEDSTVFSCWWPATVYEPMIQDDQGTDITGSAFRFPKDTWGIALDDSKIQRKLMKRFFHLAGIKESHTLILGETATDISNFDDFMVDFVSNHPDDYFLLVVDENLDVPMEDVSLKHATFSGSLLVQSMRHQLLPEQECQMLALIRSANDSKHDIAVYNSRAHGFIPKLPVNKERVRETLAKLWMDRFSVIESATIGKDGVPVSCSAAESLTITTHAATAASDDDDDDDDDDTLSSDGGYSAPLDDSALVHNIRSVDYWIASTTDDSHLERRWSEIWERLHAFKGDLLCLTDAPQAVDIVSKINEMRGTCLPASFQSKYKDLRQLVNELEEFQ